MDKRLDAATESALCGGILVALLWAAGVSLNGFVLAAQDISWSEWLVQLLPGALAGLVLPPALTRAFLRGTGWVASWMDARRRASGL